MRAKTTSAYVATTGEGGLVDFRRGHFCGMTTRARRDLPHAVGARGARRAARAGHEGRRRSRVLGYRVTSLCASGSGQFLENVARYLGIVVEDVGPLSLRGLATGGRESTRVEFIDPFRLGPTFRFLDAHQLRDENGRVIGYRDLDRVSTTLAWILIRRRKATVMAQLPERLEKNFFVPMTP